MYEKALSILEQVGVPTLREVADTLEQMGDVKKACRKYEAARAHYERCLEIRENCLGKDHPEVAQTLSAIGGLLSLMKENIEAEKFYRSVPFKLDLTNGCSENSIARFSEHNVRGMQMKKDPRRSQLR